MKTIDDILKLCNEFPLYDQYIIERVLELNHVGECVIGILSECDFQVKIKFSEFWLI